MKDMPSIIYNTIVEQNSDNTYKIQWNTRQNITGASIFVSDSPQNIDKANKITTVKNENTALISGLNPDKRYYFKIVPKSAPGVITAERRIPLEGSVNFRDLGGYETRDGRFVKWGQVFRSDSLARLSGKDKKRLLQLGVKTIVDFRSPEEVNQAPDRLPEQSVLQYLNLPIYRTGLNPVTAFQRMQAGDISWLTKDFIIKGYINSVEKFSNIWTIVINNLVRPGKRPLVFHCTAGKDRTGTCAALILRALDVPEETVIYDHGLSNLYIANVLDKLYKRVESIGLDPEKVAPYFTAIKESIVALLEHIRKNYGSVQDYLIKKAGITEETLSLLKQELLQ